MKNGCVWVFVQEEDTEEEPKLKYERLTNGVTEILQKDAASCMTVHDKVFKTIYHVFKKKQCRTCCAYTVIFFFNIVQKFKLFK